MTRKGRIWSYFYTILIGFTWCQCSINKSEILQLNKARLGQYLFYDTHLSLNHAKSCASCHAPQFAFTDGYRKSVSPMGENLLHNSPTLLNSQEYFFYDWANPTATDYQKQMQRPLYGKHPIELGLDLHWEKVKIFLKNDSLYNSLFKLAFSNDSSAFSMLNCELAIVEFLLTLKAYNSKYDRYMSGDSNALSKSEKNGMKLFTSDSLACATCHKPSSFTLATFSNSIQEVYVNIGLYNVSNQNKYPDTDNGLVQFTTKKTDDGKYKIPTLRNVQLTAPYMHDGSVSSLSEVIDLYARGGRNVTYGEYKGDGKTNINKHQKIKGFSISENDKLDLIQFLNALTDTSYLSKTEFTNPCTQ